MKRTVLEIYALSICFVTILYGVATLFDVVYYEAAYVDPEISLSAKEYATYAGNDQFCMTHYSSCFDYSKRRTEDDDKPVPRFPDDVITKKRADSYIIALNGQQHEAVTNMIRRGLLALAALLLFSVHWYIARKASKTQNGHGAS